MSLLDIFHASKIKAENQRLAAELEEKNKLLTPEMREAENISKHIDALKKAETGLTEKVDSLLSEEKRLHSQIDDLKKELYDVD